MHTIWSIAINDLLLLARDRMSLFFACVFPIVIAVFFGTIFSGPGDSDEPRKIDILLVDEDGSARSGTLARELANASDLSVRSVPDRDEALRAVRAGQAAGLVVIPRGYADRQESMFWGGAAEILIATDPSRRAESGMLEGIVTKHAFAQFSTLFSDPSTARQLAGRALERARADTAAPAPQRLLAERFFQSLDGFLGSIPAGASPDAPAGAQQPDAPAPRSGFEPIRIARLPLEAGVASADSGGAPRPPNSFSITFAQGVIWGVMGCALGFSMAMASERTRGTMLRLRVAPIAPAQILAGKAGACLIATLSVCLLVIAVGVMLFGVRPTSYPLLLVAVVCVAFCFVGIMMLLAAFGRTERGGSSLGWGVLLILSMIGGGMIPLFFMPAWMQTLSRFSPVRYALLALEGAIWRGFTPAQMLAPCLILLAVGVVGIGAGARLVRRHTS